MEIPGVLYFIHPAHPPASCVRKGNILLIDENERGERGRLALLDFGLMAEIGVNEREGMVRENNVVISNRLRGVVSLARKAWLHLGGGDLVSSPPPPNEISAGAWASFVYSISCFFLGNRKKDLLMIHDKNRYIVKEKYSMRSKHADPLLFLLPPFTISFHVWYDEYSFICAYWHAVIGERSDPHREPGLQIAH